MIFTILAIIALAAIIVTLHFSHNQKLEALDAKFMDGLKALAADVENFTHGKK